MSAYFHIIFVTLDLPVLEYAPSANVTALQINEPNNSKAASIHAEFNLKNMVSNKPLFKNFPSQGALIYGKIIFFVIIIIDLNSNV